MLPHGSGWKIWPTTRCASDQQKQFAADFRCGHDEMSGPGDFSECPRKEMKWGPFCLHGDL